MKKKKIQYEMMVVTTEISEGADYVVQWKKGTRTLAKLVFTEGGVIQFQQGKNMLTLENVGKKEVCGVFNQKHKDGESASYLHFE